VAAEAVTAEAVAAADVYPPRIRGLEKNGKGFFVALFGERA
jgi:hypothetical protein